MRMPINAYIVNEEWSILHREIIFRLFKIRATKQPVCNFQVPCLARSLTNATAVLYNFFFLFQTKLLKFICLCNTLLQTSPALLRSDILVPNDRQRLDVVDVKRKKIRFKAKVCCLT